MYKLLILLLFFTTSVFSQFGPQNDISKTFGYTRDILIFDLDEDGDNDIIAASYTDDKLGWHENYGNGVFSEQKNISTDGNGLTSFDIDDLDSDGDFDIVFSSDGGGTRWCENRGNGEFLRAVYIQGSKKDVISDDVDGDGLIDLILSRTISNNVSWSKNLGNGVFDSEQVITNLAPGSYSISTADLNGDGYLDVVSGSFDNNLIAWYDNDGLGNFGFQKVVHTSTDKSIFIRTADLDSDGDVDIYSAGSYDHTVAWYENDGIGNFSPQIVLANDVSFAISAHASDMDNDGNIDIVSASSGNGNVVWFRNQGGGVFSSKIIISSIKRAERLFCDDLDNDGLDDIVVTTQKNEIYWIKNLGGGSYDLPKIINSGINEPESMQIVDFDNDGLVDVISTCSNNLDDRIVWYKNLGNNNFSNQKIVTDKVSNPSSVYYKDIDGDLINDVISCSVLDGSIYWTKNLGNGNLDSTYTVTLGAGSMSSVFSSDLDGDGDNDLLATTSNNSRVSWYENLGSGSFGGLQPISTNANGANAVVAADLDNDGDMDVISSSYNDDKIAWYENFGAGSFSSENIITSFGDGVHSLYVCDMNEDSLLDILTVYFQADQVICYQNTGSGFIARLVSGDIDGPRSARAIDFDGDGDLDVVCSGWVEDRVNWIENLGNFSFAPKVEIDILDGAWGVEFGDIDGDGDADIISSSQHEHKISWYENYFERLYKFKGKVFFDENLNQKYDEGEYPLSNVKLNLNPISISNFSIDIGNYVFNVDSGLYTISYDSLPFWRLSTDSSTYNQKVGSIKPIIDSLNFGFIPDTIITNLRTELIGGRPRCGSISNYWIDIYNEGTTILNGVIKLTIDDSVSYVNSSMNPDSIIGNNIYWNYDSIMYFQNQKILVELQMPPFLSQNSYLEYFLTIDALDSLGNTIISYQDSLSQLFLCSYDPNDKSVFPSGVTEKGYILNDQKLEYLIRFQNTGNDTAYNVVIRDQLSENIDFNSVKFLSSSHNCVTTLGINGELIFTFDNIYLPDSTTDVIGSQGYVKFELSLNDNLIAESSILNKARIYFDLNPPIVTNSVLNTVYTCDSADLKYLSTNKLCEGEILEAQAFDDAISNVIWNVNDNQYNSDSLIWVADTTGFITLNLIFQNQFCNKSSNYQVEILPQSSLFQNFQEFCEGDSINVNGIIYTSNSLIRDTLINSLGCDSIIENIIIKNNLPQVNILYSDSILCFKDNIVLSGSGAQNYTWDNGVVNGVSFTPVNTQRYSVLGVDSNGCENTDSVLVLVNALPNVEAGLDTTLCLNENIALSGAGAQNYIWDNGVVNGQYFSPTQSIRYNVIGTDTNGCQNLDSVLISIFDTIPQAEFSYQLTGFEVSLNDSSSSDVNSWYWSIGEDSLSSQNTTNYAFTENGTYDVCLIASNDCFSDTICQQITISGVGISHALSNGNIKVYPNPVANQFSIELNNVSKPITSVLLIDISGRVINKQITSTMSRNDVITIDVSNFETGIYIYEILSNDEILGVGEIIKK